MCLFAQTGIVQVLTCIELVKTLTIILIKHQFILTFNKTARTLRGSRAKIKTMKVNRQLIDLCRRFAAAGLRVTERRDDYDNGYRNRNIACDHWRIDFLNAKEPRIGTIGKHYLTVRKFAECEILISIYNDNLELIIE